jgi:hypothetical protein
MTVTKSSQNNLTSPNGNSLAVFVDIADSTLKLKDINGNVEDFTIYLPPTPLGDGILQLQNGAPLDSTLRSVTDQKNTASPLKLSTTSAQFTSAVQITTNDTTYIDAEDGAGNNRFTIGRDTGNQQVNVDFASNPVQADALVGTIRTYRDGVTLSETMSFLKDGKVGIGTNTPIGILHLKSTAATTRMVMDGDAGQSKIITYRTAGLQRFGLYVNNTAESGSNAGSNFAIRAYSDAGTLLNTPLFIERSTGNVGIRTTAPISPLNVYNSSSSVSSVILVEQDTSAIIGQINQYRKNGSVNLISGAEIGRLSFGGYFNSTYSPFSQVCSAVLGYYGGTGTDRTGGLRLVTWNGGGQTTRLQVAPDGKVSIGTTGSNAKLQIVGEGSTSATTSLLVQNSLGTASLQVADNGNTSLGSPNFNDRLEVYGNILIRANDRIRLAGTSDGNTALYATGGAAAQMNVKNGSASVFDFTFGTIGATTRMLRVNSHDSTTPSVVVGNNATSVASAVLVAESTTQGFLPPRMTTAQKVTLAATAVAGLMIYDTNLNKLCVYTGAGWETITSV